jgi:hypothetical protein
MRPDWGPLRQELSTWRAAGLVLPLWWRDDDAVTVSPALEHMARLSNDLRLPVHIAVIPKHADSALARYCAEVPDLVPMVHGWAHANHAPPGQKKAEFGHPRPAAERETKAALVQLESLFGSRLLKVFVPPWNRIDASVVQSLAAQGYTGLSSYMSRPERFAAPDLVQINTHLDPINWRSDRGLVPPETQIEALVAQLRARRAGKLDATEPLGFLTHHLVHDAALWDFTQALLTELLDGGAQATDLRILEELP